MRLAGERPWRDVTVADIATAANANLNEVRREFNSKAEIVAAFVRDGAGLHAAAALGVTLPCGLATLPLFEDLDDPFPARDGAIALPRAPGLGLPD